MRSEVTSCCCKRSNICNIFNFTQKNCIWSYLDQNKNINLLYCKLSHMCQFCRGNIWLPDHDIIFWNTIWTAPLRTLTWPLEQAVPLPQRWLCDQPPSATNTGFHFTKVTLFQEIELLLNTLKLAVVAIRIIRALLEHCIYRKIQLESKILKKKLQLPGDLPFYKTKIFKIN